MRGAQVNDLRPPFHIEVTNAVYASPTPLRTRKQQQ